jgi:glycosyltransferase involved in cell wall biosynthesis
LTKTFTYRKRVLFNAVSAKSGGAATYAINLAKCLASIDTEHRFIFYVPSGLAKVIRDIGGPLDVVETSVGEGAGWKRFFWDQVKLRQILKREHIDVLISSSDFGMLLPPCRQILFVRNPIFFSPYYIQNIFSRKTRRARLDYCVRQKLVLLSVRFADLVMTASETMLADLKTMSRLPIGRYAVNPFGVQLQDFGSRLKEGERLSEKCSVEPFRMLYVSEYGDYKNFTALYKALAIAVSGGATNLSLLTTADPWQNTEAESVTRQEDQSLAKSLFASGVLCSAGYTSYASVPNLYAQCDLLVFPSLVESFGHPMVEAMASGLAVLASDIPVCREICGDAALYFNPCDANDLADKILRLKNDHDLRLHLSEMGPKRVKVHFDWHTHVRRLVRLIEEVAANA